MDKKGLREGLAGIWSRHRELGYSPQHSSAPALPSFYRPSVWIEAELTISTENLNFRISTDYNNQDIDDNTNSPSIPAVPHSQGSRDR